MLLVDAEQARHLRPHARPARAGEERLGVHFARAGEEKVGAARRIVFLPCSAGEVDPPQRSVGGDGGGAEGRKLWACDKRNWLDLGAAKRALVRLEKDTRREAMMRKWILGLGAAFIAASALAFVALLPTRAADTTAPSPAIWKIDGPNGRVFLFGSIHILPSGFTWRTPALEAAMNSAQHMVFEINIDEVKNPLYMMAMTARFGMLPKGESLHRLLSPERRKQFDEVVTSLGLSPTRLDRMTPWLAAMTISSISAAKQSLKPGQTLKADENVRMVPGVDDQLWTWAKSANKERGALETIEIQLRVFADLTPDEQAGLLVVTLDDVTKPRERVSHMMDAWRSGNTAQLEQELNSGMDRFPSLRRAILHNRHVRWVPQIEQMLNDGRTHLVIAGAAHMVGPDSVVAMLRAKGYHVEGP
ncbi:MAG: hypothetical protein GC190_15650 [Alphaproteobacteria bacterium]|nr:hypothetical protein [Alphaproteobacteria bacterium]